MNSLPADPFDGDTMPFSDACTAIGVAVLDRFTEDETVTVVTVRRDGNGGWWVGDNAIWEEDE
jgi:hypothetical protein